MSAYQRHLCALVQHGLQEQRDSVPITPDVHDSGRRVTRSKAAPAAAPSARAITVNNAVMELRNICNHPLIRCERVCS